ncbi:PIG-L deacetylase family protein [Prochlorococcus sp. MIT 1307]|uniref:PIG-L deacetylase family protein n=1 Tax=Prochlorococcus sp. MIT 1307 TaxID=3096219 RepID=UPI002A75674A|nr:PIG-L deacetylase family protein [Prochlorococcus sp. MIT 1307]
MRTLVVSPHPDDEVLGVGGTLLKRKSQDQTLAWLIFTKPSPVVQWSESQVKKREEELLLLEEFIGFDQTFKLNYLAGLLEEVTFGKLVKSASEVLSTFKPDEVFIPHLGDVHSDHDIVHRCLVSATKSFRQPNIKRIIAYETLSETEYGLDRSRTFSPNLYIDISNFIDQKVEAMQIYQSELGEFPFPRSSQAIYALASYRGASSGFKAAEAFEILRFRE